MTGLILLQAESVAPQTAGSSPASASLSVMDLAVEGGWIMIILALMFVLAVYIFIERYMTINRAKKDEKRFMKEIREFMRNGRLDAALSLCRRTNSPVSRMVEKGLIRFGRPLSDINVAIENVGNLEIARMEKNIASLATIAGAAPMIGFLGSVIGLVLAFYNLSAAGNNIDITNLSSGIYQSLSTTIGGLIVGIFAYLFYNILVARVEKLVYLLELRASEFMDLLYEPAEDKSS
jgi:biopolymer transport protein ExbB